MSVETQQAVFIMHRQKSACTDKFKLIPMLVKSDVDHIDGKHVETPNLACQTCRHYAGIFPCVVPQGKGNR
jgi:hypothetical protein